MIRASAPRGREPLHTTVVIAFDRATGQVHGTYVHGSFGGPDAPGVTRGRERLLTEIAARLDERDGGLDTLELLLDEFPSAGIERVDPKTRRLEVTRTALRSTTPMTRLGLP